MIYILLIIVFSFVIYYLVNSLELLSIVFCLGTVKAKKLKVIGKDIFFLRLTVLIALSILLASMIQIIQRAYTFSYKRFFLEGLYKHCHNCCYSCHTHESCHNPTYKVCSFLIFEFTHNFLT